MAQLRNPRHVRALQTGCAARGVTLLSGTPVEQLIRQGRRIAGVETLVGRLLADRVLIAAGAWSGDLLRGTGWAPPVWPVRGQMVLFQTRRPGVRPLLLQGKRYLVPRTDGRVLAGSTEEDAGFNATTTEEGVTGLIAFATSLLPSLANTPVEMSWAGLRPGSPDGMPYLGQVPGWDNLFLGAGHFRAGLLLSPASGLLLSQMLMGKKLLLPADEFRPDRPNLTCGGSTS